MGGLCACRAAGTVGCWVFGYAGDGYESCLACHGEMLNSSTHVDDGVTELIIGWNDVYIRPAYKDLFRTSFLIRIIWGFLLLRLDSSE
jgi:hypothetical protein